MTKEDIIAMAIQVYGSFHEDDFKFAALVASAEREACAKVCDWYVDYSSHPMNFAENCAQEIRARGQA